MVAYFDVADARADAIDDARSLVANNRGQVDRLVAAHGLPVGVVEAAGGDFNLLYIQPALGGVERTAACIFMLFYASYAANRSRR